MIFSATKKDVEDQGHPPDSFLTELVNFMRKAPDELSAPNEAPMDIFAAIRSKLATPAGTDGSGTPIYHWDSLLHRKAGLCEAIRVHGGMESGWRFHEGVDRSNQASMAHIERQETGLFQVSFDSTQLSKSLWEFAQRRGIETPQKFIAAMKEDHELAFEYYIRLVRKRIDWAGPLKRHTGDCIYPWLSRPAMAEFMRLLAPPAQTPA